MPTTPPIPRLLTLLLAVSCLLVGAVAPAVAHEAAPTVRAVLDEVTPEVEGLDVDLRVSVATQITVTNTGDETVTFLDPEGRPFLRIGPDGAEADVGLASWFLLNDPAGRVPPKDRLRDDPDAGPVWSRVSTEPSWGWFDHRIHPGVVNVPPEVAEVDEEVTLAEWSIPMVVGDGEVADGVGGAIEGRIVHHPVLGQFRAALIGDAPDGVELAVLQGRVPGLFLRNDSGQDVAVAGSEGEPFLRISADGVVTVNEHSPRWWAHARTSTATSLPRVAEDATAEPSWMDVGRGGTFSWLAPETTTGTDEPEDRLAIEHDVVNWSVPLTVGGGEEVAVAGVTTWVPAEGLALDCLPGPGCLQWADLLGAIGGIGVVAALIRVRRKQREKDEARAVSAVE